MSKPFVSDVVSDDFLNWHRGDVVFISTQTGSGKTTFALGEYAVHVIRQGGKVLVLEPRTILMEQMLNEVKKIFAGNLEEYDIMVRNLQIWTYQELEEKIKYGVKIPNFDVIIADEGHYFLCDSTFNANTFLSYSYVVQQSKLRRAVVVMMSATMGKIRNIFLKDAPKYKKGAVTCIGDTLFEYEVPRDYTYADVKYLTKNDDMLEIAETNRGKILWFCNSKKRGGEILEKLKEKSIEADLITADNKKDEEVAAIVKSLSKYRKFHKKVLIATSVLDVGVSIIDDEVDSVVLDTYDMESFIQMLGRIRVSDINQHLKVYIFQRKAQNFDNLLERQLKPRLNFIEQITKMNEVNITSEIFDVLSTQQTDNVVTGIYTCEGTVHLNRLTTVRLNELYYTYIDSLNGLQSDSEYMIKKQLEWLGLEEEFSTDNYVSIEIRKKKKNEIVDMILKKGEKALTEELSKNEIATFLAEIQPKIHNFDRSYVRSNEALSVKKFNNFCSIEALPFRIEQTEVGRLQKYTLLQF